MPHTPQRLYPSFPSAQNAAVSGHNGSVTGASNINSEEIAATKSATGNQSAYRVLIVDRDSMSSDLLVNALVHDNTREAATIQPHELLRVLATRPIDLVVIDAEVQTGIGNGFDLAQTVCRRYPELSIVVLLHASSQESVIRAFRAGARGVFSRQQPMSEFFDCVEHVRKGYIWAGRQETNSLIEAFRCIPSFNIVPAANSSSLTARESQVVQCAARGKTNRAIASELNLSEHTVKNYLFRAFEKLGVSSRVELLFHLSLQGHKFAPPGEEALEAGRSTA